MVYSQLNNRREAISKGLRKNTPDDVTDDLLNIRINGSALTDEEISSLIRNLNMGLVSSLACNIGNSIYFFATNKDIQHEVRSDINRLPEALDEITRLNGALVQSKRLVKQSTQIGGVTLKSGETVNVNWCSANLDEDVFEQPNTFLWGRDHSKHLMYGAGNHVCMGIDLARMQLQIAIEELFKRTNDFDIDTNSKPLRLVFPAHGYTYLPVHFLPRCAPWIGKAGARSPE